jgi:hypothetical protein
VRAIGSPRRACIEPASAHPLSSDHAPIRFSCCRPTLALHLGLDFTWLMRWEPEDALDWGERTCSSAKRTFHRWNGTFRKSFEIDRKHHSRKRAFGRGARLHQFFRLIKLLGRIASLVFRGWMPLRLFSICTWLFCFVHRRSQSVRTRSINELERIMTQHQQLSGGRIIVRSRRVPYLLTASTRTSSSWSLSWRGGIDCSPTSLTGTEGSEHRRMASYCWSQGMNIFFQDTDPSSIAQLL